MPRNTSISDEGATIVPDFIAPAEETRILRRIHEAPWLDDLSRRVQASRVQDEPSPLDRKWLRDTHEHWMRERAAIDAEIASGA